MEKRAALRAFINEPSPDDLIKALFVGLCGLDISKNPAVIHRTVYALRTRFEATVPILKAFDFDLSGINPFSELLDRVLFRLESSRILGTVNPGFAKYRVNQDAIEELTRAKQRISLGEMDQLSREFAEAVYGG